MSSAPPKPWENSQGRNLHVPYQTTANSSAADSFGMDNSAQPRPPPLPSRQPDNPYPMSGGYGSGMLGGYNSLGGLGNNYGGYGGGMYGTSGYGSMHGGGMYNSSYNRFGMADGMNGGSQNSFIRQAEESSRQAFQSIESIVQAFGSVAMMLESTFHAVYNSFRAVIGVADHFTRMKLHFSQIFSAMALLRTLKWLYHKLMVLLRLREGGLKEDVWKEAFAASEFEDPSSKRKASWPILLFFAVVIGGPWIIWKFLSSMSGEKEKTNWPSGEGDHFRAVAEFDFQGMQEDELAFSRGQKIIIAPADLQPRVKGWLLATVDGKKEGMIPANFVKILKKKKVPTATLR